MVNLAVNQEYLDQLAELGLEAGLIAESKNLYKDLAKCKKYEMDISAVLKHHTDIIEYLFNHVK